MIMNVKKTREVLIGRALKVSIPPLLLNSETIEKLFKLCESSSGYIYRFIIYVGKDNLLQFPPVVPQPPTQFGPTERIMWIVVLVFLMLPMLKEGHHLYVDNYYTSIPLISALLMTHCRNMAIHLYTK